MIKVMLQLLQRLVRVLSGFPFNMHFDVNIQSLSNHFLVSWLFAMIWPKIKGSQAFYTFVHCMKSGYVLTCVIRMLKSE